MLTIRIILSTFLIIVLLSVCRAQTEAAIQQKRQVSGTISPSDLEKEVIVAIEDEDKKQYLEQNFQSSAYEFGYEVGPNGQFHHENRGPDGVTYGCYGYVNPNDELMATHYVADGWGYRTVEPEQSVEIFRELHDETKLTAEEHKHHHGHITPWKELYFPKSCGMFPGGIKLKIPTNRIKSLARPQIGIPIQLDNKKTPIGIQAQTIRPGSVLSNQLNRIAVSQVGKPVRIQPQIIQPGTVLQQERKPTGVKPQIIQQSRTILQGKVPLVIQPQVEQPGTILQTQLDKVTLPQDGRPEGFDPHIIKPGTVSQSIRIPPKILQPGTISSQGKKPIGIQPQSIRPGTISQLGKKPIEIQPQFSRVAIPQGERPEEVQPQTIKFGTSLQGKKSIGIQPQMAQFGTKPQRGPPIKIQSQIVQPGTVPPNKFSGITIPQEKTSAGFQSQAVELETVLQRGEKPIRIQPQVVQPGIILQQGNLPIQTQTRIITQQGKLPIGIQPQIVQTGTVSPNQFGRVNVQEGRQVGGIQLGTVPEREQKPIGVKSQIIQPGTVSLNELDQITNKQGGRPIGFQPQTVKHGSVLFQTSTNYPKLPNQVNNEITQEGKTPAKVESQTVKPGFETFILSNQLDKIALQQSREPSIFGYTPVTETIPFTQRDYNVQPNLRIQSGFAKQGFFEQAKIQPGLPNIELQTQINEQGKVQFPKQLSVSTTRPQIEFARPGVSEYRPISDIDKSIDVARKQSQITPGILEYRPISGIDKSIDVARKQSQITPDLAVFGVGKQSTTPNFKVQTQLPGISHIESSTEPIKLVQNQFKIQHFGIQGGIQGQQQFTEFTKPFTIQGQNNLQTGQQFKTPSVSHSGGSQYQFEGREGIDSFGSPELQFVHDFDGIEQNNLGITGHKLQHVTPSSGISTTFNSIDFGKKSNIQLNVPISGISGGIIGQQQDKSFELENLNRIQTGTQQVTVPRFGIQSNFITQKPEKVDTFGNAITSRFDTSEVKKESKISTPLANEGIQIGITRHGQQKINVFTKMPVIQSEISNIQTGITEEIGEISEYEHKTAIQSNTSRSTVPFGFTIQQQEKITSQGIQPNIPSRTSTQITEFGQFKLQPTTPYSITPELIGQKKQGIDFRGGSRIQSVTPQLGIQTELFGEKQKQIEISTRIERPHQKVPVPTPGTYPQVNLSERPGVETNTSGQIDYSRISIPKQYPKPFSSVRLQPNTQFGKSTEGYSSAKLKNGSRGNVKFSTPIYNSFDQKTSTELPTIKFTPTVETNLVRQPPSTSYFTQQGITGQQNDQISHKSFGIGHGRSGFQTTVSELVPSTKSNIPDKSQYEYSSQNKQTPSQGTTTTFYKQFRQQTNLHSQVPQKGLEFGGQHRIIGLNQQQIHQTGFIEPSGSILNEPESNFEYDQKTTADRNYQKIPITKQPSQINLDQSKLFTSKPTSSINLRGQPRPFERKQYPQYSVTPYQTVPGGAGYPKTSTSAEESGKNIPESRNHPSSVNPDLYTKKPTSFSQNLSTIREKPSPFDFGSSNNQIKPQFEYQPQRPISDGYDLISKTADLKLKTPTQPRLERPNSFEQNIVSTTPGKFKEFGQQTDMKGIQPQLGQGIRERDKYFNRPEVQSNARQIPEQNTIPRIPDRSSEFPGLNCFYNNYPVGNCQPGIQAIDALGVQPPARSRNNFDYIDGGIQRPVLFVIPYPLPIGPNPASCPCYLVEPGTNNTIDNQRQNIPINLFNTTSNTQQLHNFTSTVGVIGFIPVVFFPYCPNNNTNMDMIKPVFPSALPIPYPCSVCNSNNNRNLYDNTFQQILLQSQLPNNYLILSPHRRRMRKIKRT